MIIRRPFKPHIIMKFEILGDVAFTAVYESLQYSYRLFLSAASFSYIHSYSSGYASYSFLLA